MALIKTKPTSPGRRFVVKADRSHLHKGEPVLDFPGTFDDFLVKHPDLAGHRGADTGDLVAVDELPALDPRLAADVDRLPSRRALGGLREDPGGERQSLETGF